jgi:5-oxoprolinase (ATP-hydrolysing)
VHTHMTNTRITDPEVFEKRYPCILRQFGLRQNSGGKGKHNGGEGTIRDIEFRLPVQCSILSERRSRQPYGLEGGEAGASGLNLVIMKDEYSDEKRVINLGAKGTIKLGQGDRIVINSPGGGGWGSAQEGVGDDLPGKSQTKILAGGSVNAYKSRQETN